MPKFNVGDVIRVLSNNAIDGWVKGNLDLFIGQVGKVTGVHPWEDGRGIKLGALHDFDWFDAEQCELAQIQVGDRVITEKFDYGGRYGFIDGDMDLLVGKVGVVLEVIAKGYCIKHEEDRHAWCWNKDAVKFALDGVAVAPAPVAKAAIIKPVKPKKPKVVKVKNLRAEMNKKAVNPGTASYAIQFKDGSVRWQIRDACHARIGINAYQDTDKTAKDVVAVATAVKPYYDRLTDEKAKANYKRFAEYIIKRSPYKDCFLPCASPVRYSVYMNLKRSVHNVAAAAIALREGSEQYAGKVSTFIWLLEQGVSEDAAWVTSRFFHPAGREDGALVQYNLRVCYAHDAITAASDTKKFFKVFKDGLYKNDKPYTEYAESYEVYTCFGAATTYGDGGATSLYKHLERVSEGKKEGQGWNARQVIKGSGVLKAAQWVDVQIKAVRDGNDVPFNPEQPKKEKKPRVRKAQYKQELDALAPIRQLKQQVAAAGDRYDF